MNPKASLNIFFDFEFFLFDHFASKPHSYPIQGYCSYFGHLGILPIAQQLPFQVPFAFSLHKVIKLLGFLFLNCARTVCGSV